MGWVHPLAKLAGHIRLQNSLGNQPDLTTSLSAFLYHIALPGFATTVVLWTDRLSAWVTFGVSIGSPLAANAGKPLAEPSLYGILEVFEGRAPQLAAQYRTVPGTSRGSVQRPHYPLLLIWEV